MANANVVTTDPASITIEIVYRDIFQKTLAQRIGRSIVLAARKRGYTGTAFGRYGNASAAQVDRAVTAAKKAQPAWAETDANTRSAVAPSS